MDCLGDGLPNFYGKFLAWFMSSSLLNSLLQSHNFTVNQGFNQGIDRFPLLAHIKYRLNFCEGKPKCLGLLNELQTSNDGVAILSSPAPLALAASSPAPPILK